MKKQITAVEWLLNEFQESHKDFGGLDDSFLELFKQAKEMEKIENSSIIMSFNSLEDVNEFEKVLNGSNETIESVEKKETLEEGIEKDFPFIYDNKEKSLLIRGAKWQQEQNKNLFSEEDFENSIKITYEETMRAMVEWFVNNKDKNPSEAESAIENYIYPRLKEKGINFKK